MRVNVFSLTIAVAIIFLIGYLSGCATKEGFTSSGSGAQCSNCKKTCPCPCGANSRPTCPPCREPDLSKYVLKSTIPVPPSCPDMSQYMLKTECPPPAPCPRPVCPPPATKVKCVAEEPTNHNVRPFLAPLSFSGFGVS